nr:MAG TPA: protein of unknown function DUF4637 [Caudoviricetes sp.]
MTENLFVSLCVSYCSLRKEKSPSQRAFLYLTKYMLKLVGKNNIML